MILHFYKTKPAAIKGLNTYASKHGGTKVTPEMTVLAKGDAHRFLWDHAGVETEVKGLNVNGVQFHEEVRPEIVLIGMSLSRN